MAKKTKSVKKRNPQDATRARDVAPIRRRVEHLEGTVRELVSLLGRTSKQLHAAVIRAGQQDARIAKL